MLVHPQFDPVALSLGPVHIHWYGISYLVAFVLFAWLAGRRVQQPWFAQAGWTRRDIEDVLFFRADDKYTCVQTAAAEFLIRTPIAELAQQLDPAQFQQVHRSTLINLRHLAGTRRDEASRLFVRIKGHAQELPVSRAYVHLFRAM